MEVRYQNSPEELKQLCRRLPLLQRPNSLLLSFLILLTLLLPGSLVLAVLDHYLLLAAFGGIGALGMIVAMRQLARKGLPRLPEVALEITPEQLKVTTEFSSGWRDWRTIKKIERLADHSMIFTEEHTFFPVPDRSFDSPEAAIRFAKMAEAYRQQAMAAGPLKDEPTAVAPLETMPQSGAMQVVYRNTSAQFERVAIRGFPAQGKDVQAGKKPSLSTIFLFVLFGVVLTLLFLVSGKDPELLRGMLAMVAVVAVTFVMLRLLQRFSRWQWRRATRGMTFRNLHVQIDQEGVRHQERYSASRHSWEWVGQIKEDDELVGLYTTQQGLLYVIPKNAFPSAVAAERFVSLARQYIQSHAEAQATSPFGPGGPAVETGNPYQSPQSGM